MKTSPTEAPSDAGLVMGHTTSVATAAALAPAKGSRTSIIAIRYADVLLSVLAAVSVFYAASTAPAKGIDLRSFLVGAQSWVAGTYTIGEGPMYEYPPYAVVALSPLSALSFEHLALLWLLLNLIATAWIVYAAIKLWGNEWSPRARYYLLVLLLVWAPFRVTLRNGQLSLVITSLLLGVLLARKNRKYYLAGCLLGLAVCKYSLSLPFLLYFVWKREWKIAVPALALPLLLTEVFALRLGLSLFSAVSAYGAALGKVFDSRFSADTGSTEIQMLVASFTAGDRTMTAAITTGLCLLAIVSMAIVFARRRSEEDAQLAAVALFSLWSVYHRTYDSVLCVIPAAVLISFLIGRRLVAFTRASLAALAVFALGLPGFLTERLGISTEALSRNPFGFVGLHLERIVVFGLFCALLVVIAVAGSGSEVPVLAAAEGP